MSNGEEEAVEEQGDEGVIVLLCSVFGRPSCELDKSRQFMRRLKRSTTSLLHPIHHKCPAPPSILSSESCFRTGKADCIALSVEILRHLI
uniref:Uncharacterized protein n=1 Tax=Onchocerca volvulus TaxID=6282 RepID=A0A8R1XR44_ONCVO